MKPQPLAVECPACGDVILVPLILTTGPVGDGDLTINVESDTADVWAHAWTHEVTG